MLSLARKKQVSKDFNHPSKASASDSASNTSATVSSQSHNTPVRDLWGLALEKLWANEKAAILQAKSDSRLVDNLRHLRRAVERKRNDCEDRSWKFELNGRQRVLRDVTEEIIAWIDIFEQIGDIGFTFDPFPASLPWAGVRFLLEVGS